MHQPLRSASQSYFWPVIWAVSLHALMFALLFVSFSRTPDLPPSRPVVQATLYQLKSQSQAETQTQQKTAGEAQKTAAREFEMEQLEQRKAEEQRVAAAKQAEQKRAEDARKADEAKKAAARKAAEAKAAEQKRVAEIAMKKAEDQAKQKAAEEAKKKAAAEAEKKKVAEAAEKKAAAEAAKKEAAEDARRKAEEDKKAQALAELLAEDTRRAQAKADLHAQQVAGSIDDLIINLISQQWRRPPTARQGMSVELLIEMLPDGTISNAGVTRTSGDPAFDNSAVAAVRSVGRIPEIQTLDSGLFESLYRKRRIIFKPEDLSP